jgi:hypothetical protein
MTKRVKAESKALERIFGPKIDEGIGDCRKLQTGEIYNLTIIYHIPLEC